MTKFIWESADAYAVRISALCSLPQTPVRRSPGGVGGGEGRGEEGNRYVEGNPVLSAN